MSTQRCIGIIDGLLDVLDEADKRAEKTSPKLPVVPAQPVPVVEEEKSQPSLPSREVNYIKSCEDVTEGQIVRVTYDLEKFSAAWKEAELGPQDDLTSFLNQVGKVIEVEEDDDTAQIQWGNFDTCWVPLLACEDANGAELTIPGSDADWLSPPDTSKDEPESKQAPYFESAEDANLKVGNNVKLTSDLALLEKEWKASELGANDELSMFLNGIGKITQIEEDDDTVELRWENYDTAWLPVKACFDAQGEKENCPVFISHMAD